MPFTTLATCSLNQWALDFEGNLIRSLESFRIAKSKGATYRLGPELELSGYGCNDHFLEDDTVLHSWQVLVELMKSDVCQNIIGDVGMPVKYHGVLYNCRVIFLNKKILLIRPKMHLANDGNYREMRWFTPWPEQPEVEMFQLPPFVQKELNHESAPFGNGILSVQGFMVGTELCEELFTPNSPHIDMSLQGVEIFCNGSASHHEFRKLHTRVDLIRSATSKCGGVYLYANQQGCDGERVYYDGCAMIVLNGEVIAQGSQFSVKDVEVVTATIDLNDVSSYRVGKISRSHQASQQFKTYPVISTIHGPENEFLFYTDRLNRGMRLSHPREVIYHSPEEEIEFGPACWLWDYMRRAKSSGFFLPLSGGIDSCATALIVHSMCKLVCRAIHEDKDPNVTADIQRLFPNQDISELNEKTLCNTIFSTCYLSTSNSSAETRERAKCLAAGIGSNHLSVDINSVVSSIMSLFSLVTGKSPRYKVHGGSITENLALQNVQARVRMVISYLFAQLLPWTQGRAGSLLVLGSANVDETLRGYLTKYDCSSADLNPIGGISKTDLRKFIAHMSSKPGLDFLSEFLEAPPTAELEPITDTYQQEDEVDMGMTYDELSVFGTLRKVYKHGPFSMFRRLVNDWGDRLGAEEIADKVKRFFFYYSINRHKTTILPPAYHMSAYSPDDNRFDLRQFLYNASWSWQFKEIDKHVEKKDE